MDPFDLEMLAILEIPEAFQTAMEESRAWCISFEMDLGGSGRWARKLSMPLPALRGDCRAR